MKPMGWAIRVTYTQRPFVGMQHYRLREDRLEDMGYQFDRKELYRTKKIASRIAARYAKNSAFGAEVYDVVKILQTRQEEIMA